MEEIRRQVSTARRRLLLQQFLRLLPWCLFTTLLLAAVALLVPKLVVLGVDSASWSSAWIGGAVAAGFLAAALWTWFTRSNVLDAAIEIDRRFGLKERVSSALSLAPGDLESELGRALVEDASRRVEVISVREKFGIQAGWRTLLPLAPALVVFLLAMFVADARPGNEAQAASSAEARKRIKKSAEELKRSLAKRRENAREKGLKEAEELIKKLHQGMDDLTKRDDIDRKKALIEINDLAKQIEKRRSLLGDSEELKKQFNKLKNLERGPAEKLADSLKAGDLEKALEQLKKLQDKLQSGEMTDEDKQQLARQLKQMQRKMQEAVEAQREAKKELERQIQKKMAEGDLEGANKLQRKLDELERQNQQMERMEKMANQLGKCKEMLEKGESDAASQQLDQLAQELEDMQAEMDELQTLDEMMDEIASAKDGMRGENGEGEMDMFSPMSGTSDRFSDMPGDGQGEGRGYGFRDEEETETGEYNARERGKLQPGEAIRLGDAFGKNKAGLSQEAIKEQILSSISEEADPLTDQKLPRSQRDHVNEYFRRLRQGE